MGRRVDIPWVGGQNTMDKGSIYMARGFDMSWVGGSIYHG